MQLSVAGSANLTKQAVPLDENASVVTNGLGVVNETNPGV